MLSAYDLLLAGVAFSVLIAGFLAGCAIYLFATDNDEAPDDGTLGDIHLAQELRRHATGPCPDWVEVAARAKRMGSDRAKGAGDRTLTVTGNEHNHCASVTTS